MNHGGGLAGVRIVVAVTFPTSASFYAGQLAALRADGADVHFLTSPSDEVAAVCAVEGAGYLPIAMERAPSPWRDARALTQVTAALARLRPDVVNAGTPKAGLLGMTAAAALRIPHRIHTLHGLRYETAHGATKGMVWLAQRVSCELAHHVVCVSRSLRERAIATGLLRPDRGVVIGDGSINGVDVERFRLDDAAVHAGAALRLRLGIAQDEVVVGYLGRLARDKGLGDLAAAWRALSGRGHRLLIAGEVDDTDPAPVELAALQTHADATIAGTVDAVAFHAAVDVLVLPSLREGFPSPPLEAAAMGRPVVATRATGCGDAVIDGETGTLVPMRDPAALAAALARYVDHPALRSAHGAAGRTRVQALFTRSTVHHHTVEWYRTIVATRPREPRR